EKEFSHVPASPPAILNLSCATAAQSKPTSSANADIANLRRSLIILVLHASREATSSTEAASLSRSTSGMKRRAMLAACITTLMYRDGLGTRLVRKPRGVLI